MYLPQMSRIQRAVAQARNVALDVAYTGRPLRHVRAPQPTHPHAHASHSCDYRLIKEILQAFPLRPQDTFVDIGCGFGRVMVVAARSQPRARVVGIEGDPAVAGAARRLSNRYPTIEVLEGWAPEPLPDDVTYAFMWNPFPASVALTVLSRIAELTSGRECRVVMLNQLDEEQVVSSQIVERDFACERLVVGGSGLLRGLELPVLSLERS